MSDSCSENTDFLVSLPSDFFQVHSSDSETIEDTVTEELSRESSSFKEVVNNLVTNLDTLSCQLQNIEKMETSYINNGLSSPLSTSSPIKPTTKKGKQIDVTSIKTLMNDMIKTYEYHDTIFRKLENSQVSRNVNFHECKDNSPVKTRNEINHENNNKNLKSVCLNNEKINISESIPEITKLDSVSKENLWLKLGEEIYQRQNIEQKVTCLEEKILNYEKKLAECKDIDQEKNSLLNELAARSALILNQVKKYSLINENISQDIISERKSKYVALETIRQKLERYKNDLSKATTQINSYKSRTDAAEKKLNEVLTNSKKVNCCLEKMKLDFEQKCKELEKIQSELINTKEDNKNLKIIYDKTVEKCHKLENEILLLEEEKKSCVEKTTKYDQLLDQKRRIEEIVNQMKNSESQTIEELNEAKEEIKTIKNELKLFYQKQVDAMLADKVTEYQRKLDGIVQMTNEENNLIKRQMANKMSSLKEKYEKEKLLNSQKHSSELEKFQKIIKEKNECIKLLEKQLNAEILEKQQLVKSVIGVVKNVNVENQTTFNKSNSDIKYQKKNFNNEKNSSKIGDHNSFYEHEKLLRQISPTELRKHIEILLNKPPGEPL
ncbi:putative autophagy-related protein 11 [Daktulosphaira vitifoliae]|uniref:putative autophagy-related protein 11 n=1 Tax=Daktulosphaira vitifoliae TaxID=58002 RepID=UPI0021A9C15D|nr:putative autophagy-related protein 11 [Daktulosphaira vitifoliae]